MAAFAFQGVGQENYYIRIDSGIAQQENDYALLLDAARQSTQSLTAVLYLVDGLELNAITARANLTPEVKDVGVTLSAATTAWIGGLDQAVQGQPADAPHFEKFPEILQYRLRRLAVVPLRDDRRLLGLLTLGRQKEDSFDLDELAVAERAGRLLTAVLERDSLKEKLIERKLVERAKGLLQQRRHFSEEQAYLTLRNHSRQHRIPMADIAREIIDATARTGPLRSWQTRGTRLSAASDPIQRNASESGAPFETGQVRANNRT